MRILGLAFLNVLVFGFLPLVLLAFAVRALSRRHRAAQARGRYRLSRPAFVEGSLR